MIKNTSRKTNIECLRIVNILMIISFHYAYKGGWNFGNFTVNEYIIKIFMFFGELGVNLFMLITGYFMCDRKMRVEKVLRIAAEVFFYHMLTIVVACSFKIMIFPTNIRSILLLMFPITLKTYWFITVYVMIYILSPYINKIISSFSKRMYIKFLLSALFIWSVIPTFFGLLYDSTETMLYYNRFIWCVMMYFTGAYIKRYPLKVLSSQKMRMSIGGVVFLLMAISILIIEKLEHYFAVLGTTQTAYLWQPNNIPMFVLSICIFHVFLNMDVPYNKMINKLGSTTLGVYVLHDGLCADYLWKGVFKTPAYQNSPFLIFHIIGTPILVFIVCAVIDLIRQHFEHILFDRFLNSKSYKAISNKVEVRFSRLYDWIENRL